MGQLVMAIKGLGEACRALDFPVVSGNVSLYNETNGRGILPTPAIVGVGLIPDITVMVTLAFKRAGDEILLVGGHGGHMGQTLYLREILGREEGLPPPVDLDAERRNGDLVRALIRERAVTACHDLSDGGLAVALAEMAIAGRIGADVALDAAAPHVALFAEDQARYILTVPAGSAVAVLGRAADAGVPALRLGTVGGDRLKLGAATAISVADLAAAHEDWLPRFMAGAEVAAGG
jgi:phosphoribosylformylglycinamidine synthase